MRVIPFEDDEPVIAEPQKPAPRISLLDRLKPRENTSKKATEQKTDAHTDSTTPNHETETGHEEAGAEKASEDTFEEFEKNIADKLDEADSIELSKMLVQFGNIGRMIFLPGLYEGFAFPGQERNDIHALVMPKVIANEKDSKPADEGFNNYEKRLYNKWLKLRIDIENVSFTEPEINTLAKYIAAEIKDMTVSVWMKKYRWAFYWMYLEVSHAKGVIGGRASDFVTKKFG